MFKTKYSNVENNKLSRRFNTKNTNRRKPLKCTRTRNRERRVWKESRESYNIIESSARSWVWLCKCYPPLFWVLTRQLHSLLAVRFAVAASRGPRGAAPLALISRLYSLRLYYKLTELGGVTYTSNSAVNINVEYGWINWVQCTNMLLMETMYAR